MTRLAQRSTPTLIKLPLVGGVVSASARQGVRPMLYVKTRWREDGASADRIECSLDFQSRALFRGTGSCPQILHVKSSVSRGGTHSGSSPKTMRRCRTRSSRGTVLAACEVEGAAKHLRTFALPWGRLRGAPTHVCRLLLPKNMSHAGRVGGLLALGPCPTGPCHSPSRCDSHRQECSRAVRLASAVIGQQDIWPDRSAAYGPEHFHMTFWGAGMRTGDILACASKIFLERCRGNWIVWESRDMARSQN